MNEKIKLLCREKSDYWMNHYDRKSKADMELLYQDVEKFAELIIKECANWIKSQDEAAHPTAWSLCDELKEHFGVGR